MSGAAIDLIAGYLAQLRAGAVGPETEAELEEPEHMVSGRDQAADQERE